MCYDEIYSEDGPVINPPKLSDYYWEWRHDWDARGHMPPWSKDVEEAYEDEPEEDWDEWEEEEE